MNHQPCCLQLVSCECFCRLKEKKERKLGDSYIQPLIPLYCSCCPASYLWTYTFLVTLHLIPILKCFKSALNPVKFFQNDLPSWIQKSTQEKHDMTPGSITVLSEFNRLCGVLAQMKFIKMRSWDTDWCEYRVKRGQKDRDGEQNKQREKDRFPLVHHCT